MLSWLLLTSTGTAQQPDPELPACPPTSPPGRAEACPELRCRGERIFPSPAVPAPPRSAAVPCPSFSPCRGHPPPRSEALRLFNAILHIIPLLVVESRKEADEVRELVSIARWVARLLGCHAC